MTPEELAFVERLVNRAATLRAFILWLLTSDDVSDGVKRMAREALGIEP